MPEQWRARVNVWFLEVSTCFCYVDISGKNAPMLLICYKYLWQVGVALALQPHTIATASILTDRYLSFVSVTRRDLAIVSTTAILIAAKVHEIWIPDLVRISRPE